MKHNKVRVVYNEVQPNKLLIDKEKSFTTLESAYRFCTEMYMSGKSKGRPVIEERAA